MGKGQQGGAPQLKTLAKQQGFNVEYVDKLLEENEPISSRRIRQLIQMKDFKKASRLLGRPYSLFGKLELDLTHGHKRSCN